MTSQDFVLALKTAIFNSAANEVEYYKHPQSKNPPDHLKRFSTWFNGLSESDKELVEDLVIYSKEGALFSLLTYLDNLAFLTKERGKFELFYLSDKGQRVLLNESDGELLTDIFNNEG